MFKTLSAKHLHRFLNNPKFTNNGFEMLDDFIGTIHPSRPENRLSNVRLLGALEQRSQENTAAYFERVRGFAQRLKGVTIDTLMPLFALNGMYQSLYNGTLSRFTSGDPTLISADLTALEDIMTQEVSIKRELGIVSQAGSASRAQGQGTRPPPADAVPTPSVDRSCNHNNSTTAARNVAAPP